MDKYKGKSQEWIEKEKERCRAKYHRLQYKGKYNPSTESKRTHTKNYAERWPEKHRARTKVKNSKCSPKLGFHLHHWSYKEGFELDLIELPIRQHLAFHIYLVYDEKNFLYRRKDNDKLLDTKKKHFAYFEELIKEGKIPE